MFSDIKRDSSSKLLEVREFLDLIQGLIPSPPAPTPNSILTSKGLFFVHIYGVFEYTITASVQKTILLINSSNININDCKPLLFSMALSPQCDAISSTNARNWKKRWELFENIEHNTIVNIAPNLFPTDGKNIRYNQLESIWKTFCISAPILNIPSMGGRITEIVDNRNLIAHGNDTAANVGSRISIGDLYSRYSEMSNYCSYIIEVFENYIENEEYLK